MKRLLFIFTLIISVSASVFGQYVPGTDWKQIKTDNFQIIFPAELEQDARRTALITEEFYKHNTFEGIRHPYKRWPLVLTNSSTVANGFVDPYNQRSVWYGTPAGEMLGGSEWYKLLAVHEGRHITQTERYKRGFLYLGYLFSGNIATALGGNLVNPAWFAEGDAVDRETMFTEAGRGRNTMFHREMEAIILEEDGFGYQKVKNGSYRDNIPNHYYLGYPMVAYTRSTYGEDSWDEFMEGATWLPVPILGPTAGTLYATGHTPHRLYYDMIEHWENVRREQMKTEVYTGITELCEEPNDYRTYDSLSVLADGSVVARRHSMSSPAVAVRLRDGAEEVLGRVSGYDPIVFGMRMQARIETIPDLRYDFSNCADIYVTDNGSGKSRRLTAGGRYTDLALNRTETEIAAIEWSLEREASVAVLDIASGIEKHRTALPDGIWAYDPVFSPDGRKLMMIVCGGQGIGLAELDLSESGKGLRMLMPYSSELIRRPSYSQKGILFSSNYSGREAIYLMDEDGSRELIAMRPYTAVEPVESPDGSGFYYLDYNGMKGERIVRAEYPEPGSLELPENRLGQTIVPSFGFEEGEPPQALAVEPSAEAMAALEVEEYFPAANLFRIITWTPVLEAGGSTDAADPANQAAAVIDQVGLSVTSHDVLGTLDLVLQGGYYLNEKTFGGRLSADYKALYPVISLSGEYVYRRPETGEFHEISPALTLSLPLNFSRGLWSTGMNVAVGFSGIFRVNTDGSSAGFAAPLSYGLVFNHLLSGSERNLTPVLGIGVKGLAAHTPFNASNEYLLSASATGYLPGGFSNTIRLNAGLEQQNSIYASQLPGAKGYETLSGNNLLHLEAEYLFPIFYPDFAIGPFAYLKRFRGDVFGQFTRRDGENFSSAGLQIDLDFTVADIPIPFSVGFRGAWLFEQRKFAPGITIMSE